MYSGKVSLISNQLNTLIREACKLKYNPVVKVRKTFQSENIPYVSIEFFHPTDKNILNDERVQKCRQR